MILVGVHETPSSSYAFLDLFALKRPCIVDNDKSVYDSYGTSAGDTKVPLNVVVDRDGIIQYYNQESNITEVQAAIQRALDAP
jgi:peroxiredoxin